MNDFVSTRPFPFVFKPQCRVKHIAFGGLETLSRTACGISIPSIDDQEKRPASQQWWLNPPPDKLLCRSCERSAA